MKTPKIIASVSNILTTVFLVILIPATIIGTIAIATQSKDIRKNTEYRERMERTQDSLKLQLRLEKRINTMHRDNIKDDINDTSL